METIINNPRGGDGEGSGVGMIVGVIVAIILIVLFFVYALPALRGGAPAQNPGIDVNIDLPTGGDTSPAPGQ